jgi:hypothetical protein
MGRPTRATGWDCYGWQPDGMRHILPIFPIRSEAAAFLGLYLAVDTCVPW